MEEVDTDINPTDNSQMTQEKTIVHLPMKTFIATTLTGLILATGFGTFNPASAVIDCDKTPDAPLCSGEPRPRPRPKPQPTTPKPAPAPTNYPAAIAFVLKNSNLIEQAIDKVWNNFGKGVVAQKIKDELNGKRVGTGMRIKDVNVNLRNITVKEVKPGPAANQISVRVVIPNNNEEFHVSVPLIPDPSFRVFHDLTMNLILTIDNSSEPIKVARLNVQVSNADVRGSNLIGSVVKALGDFFTGGDFSRGIESKINQDIPLLKQLGGVIKSAIDSLPIPK
ncbi:hypothetical protein [Chamaesiphon minutus]|uniref:Uncharacterized protein n=1 Tax=Chamaesiphon minutus (strain ATCC 27169 / PCC 6605) TaxID=1173020 RepID=K9UF86_CHAP6|nr:hypothetical protein [Chamaesiphon minutus]AFY93495.1 hypothetical protein Cha6605_2437 [Chamaesiphon minutus PCC 6605]